MRIPSVGFSNGLNDAPTKGIVPRRLIFVKAKNRTTGAIVGGGFWTGDETLDFTVKDGQTGNTVSRSYIGLGTSLVIPSIPRISDLTIQTIDCGLPQTHPAVQSLVRDTTVRFAKVDIHECLLSTVTRRIVANPEVTFFGECDTDWVSTPEAQQAGSITLEIVSDAIRALTRTNSAKSSAEAQKRRSGDLFNSYANTFQDVTIPWGKKD